MADAIDRLGRRRRLRADAARHRDWHDLYGKPAVKVDGKAFVSHRARSGQLPRPQPASTRRRDAQGNRSRHLLADAALRRLARRCWSATAAPIPSASRLMIDARLVGPRRRRTRRSRRRTTLTHFTRFAAIDWSGAKGSRHRGIALAVCEAGDAAPVLVDRRGGVWSRTDDARLAARAPRRADAGRVRHQLLRAVRRARRVSARLRARRPTRGRCGRYVDANSADEDLGAASFLEAGAARISTSARPTARRRSSSISAVREALHNDAGLRQGVHASTTRSARRRSPRRASPGCACSTISTAAIAVWPFDPVPARACRSSKSTPRSPRAPRGSAQGVEQDARRPRRWTTRWRRSARTARAARPLRRPRHRRDPRRRVAPHQRARPELWAPAGLTAEIARTEGWTFGVA